MPPYEDCFRAHCSPPKCHDAIYVQDGDFYDHQKWSDYRNPAFRHRPQPILTLKVAAGFWQHLLLVVVISFALVIYHHYLVPKGAPSIDTGQYGSGLLSMATFFLSLLLVFKLNNSYARWWEARTQWGTALAMLRNYLTILNSWTSNLGTDSARAVAAKAARWAPAIMFMFKAHLREEGGDPVEAASPYLTEDELKYLSTCTNKPLAGGHVLNQLAVELGVHPIIVSSLQGQISQFLLQLAGAERIFRCPLPQSYHRFASRAIMIYIVVAPLLVMPVAGWMTPLVALIIAFMLLGVEHISAQIEEPFRVLHLGPMCNAVLSASKEPWAQNQGLKQGSISINVDMQAVVAEQEMKK
jgi:putative membrane protein